MWVATIRLLVKVVVGGMLFLVTTTTLVLTSYARRGLRGRTTNRRAGIAFAIQVPRGVTAGTCDSNDLIAGLICTICSSGSGAIEFSSRTRIASNITIVSSLILVAKGACSLLF